MTFVPHDLDAERHLLGAMLITTDAVAAVQPVVVASDFYHAPHAALFDRLMTA